MRSIIHSTAAAWNPGCVGECNCRNENVRIVIRRAVISIYQVPGAGKRVFGFNFQAVVNKTQQWKGFYFTSHIFQELVAVAAADDRAQAKRTSVIPDMTQLVEDP